MECDGATVTRRETAPNEESRRSESDTSVLTVKTPPAERPGWHKTEKKRRELPLLPNNGGTFF